MTTQNNQSAVLPRLLLLAAILTTLGAGIYFLFHWLPDWEHLLLFGLMTFSVVVTIMMLRDMNRPTERATVEGEPIPDAASPEEQQAALEHLASLPHFRALSDGSLFDYLQGSTITPCQCGKYSPLHLMVRYGKGRRYSIALVSRGALTQYLSVQDAVAVGLRHLAPRNGQMPALDPAGGVA